VSIIIYLAEAFLVAYIMRLVSYRLKIPAVSGYVVGGVLLGGSLFYWIPGAKHFINRWLFSEGAREQLTFITHIALGTIALTIGAELEWKRIKTLGKSICCIALFEASGAFFVVFLVTWLIWKDFPLSLILGAISSATAPAATVSVIQQYKAQGPLTRTILAVVGIDDAISFIIFAFALLIVKAQLLGQQIDLMSGLVRPLLDIFISLGIGSGIGIAGARLLVTAKDQETVVFLLGAIILWTTGISAMMDVSELLANMASGVVIVNVYPHLKGKIRASFSSFMPLFYALFFIIGGSHLNLSALPLIWGLSLVYFGARVLGKTAGAYCGATVSRALPQVRSLVGFALLPQVGAAIALALVVQQEFGEGDFGDVGVYIAKTTINVLLVTTLMTEFIGPYLTKLSLIRAGETRE